MKQLSSSSSDVTRTRGMFTSYIRASFSGGWDRKKVLKIKNRYQEPSHLYAACRATAWKNVGKRVVIYVSAAAALTVSLCPFSLICWRTMDLWALHGLECLKDGELSAVITHQQRWDTMAWSRSGSEKSMFLNVPSWATEQLAWIKGFCSFFLIKSVVEMTQGIQIHKT